MLSIKAEWHFSLLAMAAYVVAIALFCWRIVALGMVPTGHDTITFFFPYKAYLAQLVRQGELPLWNPLTFMGTPLLANIQFSVFYPPDLVFYLLPTTDALRFTVVFHLLLAAIFTYLFGRLSLGLSPVAAWLAGLIFALVGFVGAKVEHLNQFHAAVWLPMILLCLEQAASRRNAPMVALGAAAFAFQILAGHTQIVYYSGLVMGLFALFMSAFAAKRGWHRLSPLAALAAMVAGGLAISGAQLLPSIELMREGFRYGGMVFSDAVTFAVRPREILSAILPFYFQAPYLDMSGFTGVISLTLLPAALLWRGRFPFQWFFAALGLLALLLSMGAGTPLYGWLFKLVPGFDLFRSPGRWLLPYSFSVALMAGMGIDAYKNGRKSGDWRRMLSVSAVSLLGFILGIAALKLGFANRGGELSLPPSWVVSSWGIFAGAGIITLRLLYMYPRFSWSRGLLVGLVLLDLYLAKEPLGYNNPTVPSLYTGLRAPYVQLEGVPSTRILSLASDQFELAGERQLRARLPAYMTESEIGIYMQYSRFKETLSPNVGMIFGLNSFDGYEGGLLPTRRFVDLKRNLLGPSAWPPHATIKEEATQAGMRPDSRLLSAFGVRYLLIDKGDVFDPAWEELETSEGLPVRLLRNPGALQRAFVVHDARVLLNDKQSLEALRSMDLTQTVVLSEDVDFPRSSGPGKHDVLITRDDPMEVVVEVTLEKAAFLVLSDSYYPGWRAYIDGLEVTLHRANYLVRAVFVPSGSHRIRFVYDPFSFKAGLAISVIGIFAVASIPFIIGRIRLY